MAQDEIAIKVTNVSKTFKLPHEKKSSIKSLFVSMFHGKRTFEKQQVLKDVSFEVKKGEFFGIVGRNGSGKSTLLKLMAGIYTPDSGKIGINGKLTPFIELGVGFNPELTGRENVFLNGALLGFNRKDMLAMYDEIVEFAELEKFMDQKLKNYSSGMQVRLAFSVAIRAKGDILLLDEVLAVGDEAFQRKCYEYFAQLKREKRTVVLVTHSMPAVESFCTSALMLDDGKIKIIGNTRVVSTAYSKANDEYTGVAKKNDSQQVAGISVKTFDGNGKELRVFKNGEFVNITLSWKHNNVENAGLALFKNDGSYIYGTNTFIEDKSFKNKKSIKYKLKLNVAEGEYYFKVGLFGENDQLKIAYDNEAADIAVNANRDDYRWQGITKLESEWM
ncbi:MAG: ABC transporter ATP-binding protein [bacterium]|nr:ABC transporter ATP-binding protein [bacterium]